MIGLLSILFAFTACSKDSIAIIDVAPPAEPEYDSALFGSWTLDPSAGALAVGPNANDLSWWSNSAADVTTRNCFFDDLYVFNEDGTFQNIPGDETWQGVAEDGCGEPIAPHDGTTVGTWSTADGTVTITGTGLYLGLSKVHNTGENGEPANVVGSFHLRP